MSARSTYAKTLAGIGLALLLSAGTASAQSGKGHSRLHEVVHAHVRELAKIVHRVFHKGPESTEVHTGHEILHVAPSKAKQHDHDKMIYHVHDVMKNETKEQKVQLHEHFQQMLHAHKGEDRAKLHEHLTKIVKGHPLPGGASKKDQEKLHRHLKELHRRHGEKK